METIKAIAESIKNFFRTVVMMLLLLTTGAFLYQLATTNGLVRPAFEVRFDDTLYK